MKKKILMGMLCALAIACIAGVYIVGGQTGAYVWNLAVFILSPLAVIATLVQLLALLLALFKRQNVAWRIGFIAVSLLFTLPITVLLGVSPIGYPANADPADGVTVTIPVEDAVLFGGPSYKTHAMWPSECYAYDLLAEPHDVGSENLHDYGIFGREVRAPVAGTVIAVENHEPDIPPNTDAFTSLLGNYVFIKIDDTGTYLILAHFQQNSITVQAGEHVSPGQIIGNVGNSGTTSEPHLHIQHQRNDPMDVAFPTCAVGLPLYFA